MVTNVFGVDPGLVHTGLVHLGFDQHDKVISVGATVISGLDAVAVARTIQPMGYEHMFIEAYRPRSNYGQDQRMVEGVREIHKALPGSVVLPNTGVKKVVRPALLKLLGVNTFGLRTNHDDLRSAARIAVLGMLKDPTMNTLLSDIVHDHLEGAPWDVRT